MQGGWSDAPYRWAVGHSSNKKVAVISYSDEDNFIPDYFKALGAVDARNIRIASQATADLQSTYDELMQYDVFFFKGGDQYNYYQLYKGTKTAQATIDKFHAGGVISGTSAGMAILSSVIFTAKNGSVYPDEALDDFTQSSIDLADDFLPLFPGFIFDSHFTERGRIGRLLPFMGKWFMDTGELISGIGVDDRTALAIDENKLGMVYGTGTVGIYTAASFSAYQDEKLLADSVHAIQLLHGHSIDLAQKQIITGPEEELPADPASETGNYQVLLSGSEGVNTNTAILNSLIQETHRILY